MTLRARLSRLQAQAGSRPVQAAKPATSSLQRRLAHLCPERLQGQPRPARQRMSIEQLSEAVRGVQVTQGLIRIEEQIPLSGTLCNTSMKELSHTPQLPGETTPPPSLYIDTETTGLSGGTGTLAYLVGVAEVRDNRIQLTQLLITSFNAEPALLAALSSMISAHHRLVSYNGKSYDLPLLSTRYRMQGMQHSLDEVEHLDLFHPMRRLFAKRWEDCRLTTVERQMFGFIREDDLPGAEAPEAWFAYMQRGDGERLLKVVAHNRQDILSLAMIHLATSKAVQQPLHWGVDLHGLARWILEINEADALRLLKLNRDKLCDEGKRLLGYLLRRAECWGEAVPVWEELALRGCVDSTERLAKYHEHISRDLHAALRYCKKLPGSSRDNHRRARIETKLGQPYQCEP